MRAVARASLLALGISSAGLPVWAQAAASQPAGPRLESATGYYLAYAALYDRVPSQAADRKDPLVAGLLSWFIPGLGSFYAGRSGHGVRHVVIHVVALGAVIAGVVSSADAAAGSGINADESRDEVLIIGGTAVLLLNGIWSIITAVGDANAYNRGTGRPGRVVGSLYVDPSVRALSSYGLLAAGVPHPTNTGIQLLSLGF